MEQIVVIRGSLQNKFGGSQIQTVIDSIRSWHSGLLILSTWVNEFKLCKGLSGVDRIILSQDPGQGPIQNFSRQLTAYYFGVRDLNPNSQILVTRTDTCHFQNPFNLRNKFPNKTSNLCTGFIEKLLIGNIMSIRPLTSSQ